MSSFAAVTNSTVGLASAATASRTSDASSGSFASRAPTASLRLVGNPQALSRCRPALQPDQLAPQLQREERVPAGCLLHPTELRPGQMEIETLAEQMTKRSNAQRAKLQLPKPPLRQRIPQSKRERSTVGTANGREHPEPLPAQAPERNLQHTG